MCLSSEISWKFFIGDQMIVRAAIKTPVSCYGFFSLTDIRFSNVDFFDKYKSFFHSSFSGKKFEMRQRDKATLGEGGLDILWQQTLLSIRTIVTIGVQNCMTSFMDEP